MIQATYPGVYVEELPSGVHTITGVATSIAAFVGYTARGQDNRPKHIFSWSDFTREFGGLASDSELSYAVQQFFNNGGTEAYVVRIPRAGATYASVTINDKLAGTIKPALKVTALSAGSWANGLLVDIDYNGFSDPSSDSYNLTITDPSTGTVESFVVSQDAAANNYVVAVVNDEDNGSQMVNVTVPDATASRPFQTGISGTAVTLPITGPITVRLSSDAPSTLVIPSITVLNAADSATTILGLARIIERNLNQALGSVAAGTSVSVSPNEDGGGLRVVANFDQEVWPGSADAVLTIANISGTDTTASQLKLFATGAQHADINVAHYVMGDGSVELAQAAVTQASDGSGLPTTANIIGDSGLIPPTGIYALEQVDIFNILCIPDATRAAAGNPQVQDSTIDSESIFSAALTYCVSRRAFLLVDPPANINNVDRAVDWKSNVLSNLGNSYGAAYFPRLKLADPLNDYNLRTFAPCGVIAGLYSRIDSSRGVWKAPAGTEATLTDVQAPAYKLSDRENGALNPLGLNCLRSFPVYGNICWGARTLRGADELADEWKYVPVRRLALYIEESLFRGTKWVVFEPNDDPLWAQIRLNLTAFMNTLFKQGAFAGTSAKQAYLVKCDHETTTQDDVNRGVVNILVGFAPLKPAEFVYLQIQQLAGQTQS